MAYDESRDVVIASEVFAGERDTYIEVKLVSRDKKDPQLQFSRFAEKGGESEGESVGARRWMKLGRLSIAEAKRMFEICNDMVHALESDDNAAG